jgi:hypothetical protein
MRARLALLLLGAAGVGAVWDTIQHAGGHACIRWRQTGGCVADGPRERLADRNCDERISWRASGYCECAGGLKSHRAACGHAEFSCAKACAAPRPTAPLLPVAELGSLEQSVEGLRLEDCPAGAEDFYAHGPRRPGAVKRP